MISNTRMCDKCSSATAKFTAAPVNNPQLVTALAFCGHCAPDALTLTPIEAGGAYANGIPGAPNRQYIQAVDESLVRDVCRTLDAQVAALKSWRNNAPWTEASMAEFIHSGRIELAANER